MAAGNFVAHFTDRFMDEVDQHVLVKSLGMKRAALGVRMHSGWGVLVAVAVDSDSVEVVDRRRIVVTDAATPEGTQPYHHAARLGSPPDLSKAEKLLADWAAVCEQFAVAAIQETTRKLEQAEYQVAGCALLLASGRALPPLAKILAAHPLIHTADGEFFRDVVRKACKRLKIPVTAIRERDLDDRAKTVWGKAASGMQNRISKLGRSIGPPWTTDHKAAALAAAIVLTLQ